MAINVGNITVISDSRTLNINSADISGPAAIVANSSNPALALQNTSDSESTTGLSLLVKGDTVTNLKPFSVDSDGRVSIGTEVPLESMKLALATENPILGFRQQGTANNGVYGWTFRETNGALLIDRRTSADFENFNSVIQLRSINTVGINPTGTTIYPFEVRTSAVVQNSNNLGLAFVPEIQGTSTNIIWARDSSVLTNRGLQVIAEQIRVFTGTNDQTTGNLRLTINSSGNSIFSGTVTANQFNGPGTDWYYLGSVDASGTSVDINFGTTYKHYAILFNNIRGTAEFSLNMELRDSGGSLIGPGTYKYSGVGSRTDQTTLNILVNNGSNFWTLNGLPITPNNVDGSISGEIALQNISTTSAWKSFQAISSQYYFNGSAATESLSQIGGFVNSTTAATTIRFTASTGNFSGGSFRLYGIRT